jgi:hypothetical protein
MSEKNSKLETTEHLRNDFESKQDENLASLIVARNKDWFEKEQI